jgi:hypothetical protein
MKNSLRSRTIRSVLVVVGLFLFYVLGVIVRQQYGIGVVIRNESGETLRQVGVKVETKGKRYGLPDLAPGDRRRVFVQPVGESSIDIQFIDAGGKPHVELMVGYVESGYCGNAKATILPGGRTKLTEDIDPLFCGKSWLDFVSAKNSTPSSNPRT